jgi:hypothetical protein
LRKSQQKDSGRICNTFADHGIDQIDEGLMVNSNGFFRMKVCEPAKTESQRPAGHLRILQVLMRALQRCEGETLWRNHFRFARRVPLAGAVTMQRD